MTTRLVHIGDIHQRSTSARNPLKLAALDQIVAEGLTLRGLGAWLIPGDLFDTRSTIEDRNEIAARLSLMATAAPVVTCYGNHDSPGDLDIFARLKARYPVHVIATPSVVNVALATGHTAAIAVLPYPNRSGLVSAGVQKSEVVSTATDLLDGIFIHLGDELRRREGALPLFMAHVNVAGSCSSSGQPQIGMEVEIDTRMLTRVPAVYHGLNHIHLPQEVGVGVYAGSIAPMSWGEIERKSYVVITCDQVNDQWTASWERRPIHTPAMWHVDGTLTREGFEYSATDGTATVVPTPTTWKGCHVRIRARFRQSEKSVLDMARVLVDFAEAARVELEPIAVPDRQVRAPQVAEARTLEAKLAAYMGVDEVSPALVEKLRQLETAEPVTVLTHVQQALAAIEVLDEQAVYA